MRKIVVLVVGVMILAACQSSKIATGPLEVKGAWSRPALKGDNGAVYLVIENGTSQDDALLSVGTNIASAVELHQSQVEGDQMSMHQLEEVMLPVGEAVEFSPGGLHLMLAGLTRELTTGDTFDITLVFEKAGEKVVTVIVQDDINND